MFMAMAVKQRLPLCRKANNNDNDSPGTAYVLGRTKSVP
eukprot:CAMPEP_0172465250 /NCGR_PEP_ID=MMETSP1065-20121228/52917_1 /TAXON_ID=265537 /ORGANISM="Amphiprora paludosa, Strain CCMP125" /LENGTH=38 /DNA_ID= /DNA_START= /DNA_END= /DNA_ORIENTATION=